MRKGLIITLIIVQLLLGCEIDTTVSVDSEYPPTFTLHGSGGINFLRVYDMTDPQSMTGEWWEKNGIWEIAPESGGEMIRNIPPITYGKVPPRFVQKTPSNGAPLALIEGRKYWVWTRSYDAGGGGSYTFTIRDGYTVELKE